MNIIVMDTETGDLSHEKCALTAIGVLALRLEGGKLLPLKGEDKIRELEILIRPCKSLRLTDRALAVQGLTREEIFADPARVTEAKALEILSAWLQGAGFKPGQWPIWAHNAEFDRNHLGAAIRRRVLSGFLTEICGRDATWFCTRSLAQNQVALGAMPRPKGDGGEIKPGFSLDALCHHFGIDVKARAAGHGALADAKLCARVLVRLNLISKAHSAQTGDTAGYGHAQGGRLAGDSGGDSPISGALVIRGSQRRLIQPPVRLRGLPVGRQISGWRLRS